MGFYLLKGMGAISHGECFANAFPYLFSREILRAVKKAIAILDNENVGRIVLTGVKGDQCCECLVNPLRSGDLK